MDMEEKANDLRSYIILKIHHPEITQDSQEFNQHIADCDFCSGFRSLSIMLKYNNSYFDRKKQNGKNQ